MTRKIAIAILFIVYFFNWIILGFVFSPFYGVFVGVATACCLLVLFFIYGEKIILSIAKARYINDDENLVSRIRNMAYLNEIPEIKVYWSQVYHSNVYSCHSLGGTPSIIVGRRLVDGLSKNELNALIYASLQQIKSKESLSRTLFNLLMMNILAPLKFLTFVFKRIQQKQFFQIFLLPTYFLKNALYDDVSHMMKVDKEVVRLSGLKYEYASALFKISETESLGADELSNFVMSHMTAVENKNKYVLKDLIFHSVSVKERLKELDVIYA